MGALTQYVAEYGAAVIFVLAILETSFVTGLVVPSGMTAAFAAAVSTGQTGDLVPIFAALVAGGFIGDVVGYWIGYRGGERLQGSDGWVGRAMRRHEPRAARFFGRHPFFSVTLARLVAFVRTLMPMGAGMARISFPVYLVYEVPGLLAWAALYVGIGVVAGESWQQVSGLVGAGWIALFIVAALIVRFRSSRVSASAKGQP